LPDNPLIYVNAGFERLTGYSADEVMGRNCRFLQGAETDTVALGHLRAALREQREIKVQLLNYRKMNYFLEPSLYHTRARFFRRRNPFHRGAI